jgi:predicted SAM-dependent methyltransferase
MEQHTKRNVLLNMIAAHSDNNKLNLGLFLNGAGDTMPPLVSKYNCGAKFGMEMYETLKSGKIVIDARGDIRLLGDSELNLAGSETMNMRIFEATGCGAFLLTEYYENLNDLFEIGVEIETFSSESELLKKIDYYLKHDDKRNAIARRGQKRCLRDYSMVRRVDAFDSLIKKHLKIAATEIFNPKEKKENNFTRSEKIIEKDVPSLFKKATGLIAEKYYSQAFEILNYAKSFKTNYKNIDLLRALCFIDTNDFISARQALLEELSFNPDNEHAKVILNKLKIEETDGVYDPAFESAYDFVRSYTMLSKQRLYCLYQKAKEICDKDIKGNFVECGVARGGSSALLAHVIKTYSKSERYIYSFDTFEGMPEPTPEDIHNGSTAEQTGWGTGTCAAPMESLLKIGNEIGASDYIIPVKGFFRDTLPGFKNIVGELAFLHLDGDWYESTGDILNNLYDNVVFGGYLQVDDYGYWEGCRKALHEFEFSNDLKFELNKIDDTGVWFTKPFAETRQKELIQTDKKLLNLGCGNRFHKDWLNVDSHPDSNGVIAFDLKKELPFENGFFEVVYHSHLLEHFPKSYAPKFLSECSRILKSGGIIRIVVPDLEQITRHYINFLEQSLNGDIEAQKKYNWILLELYDQTVRNYSGGQMLKYLQQDNIPAEDFVIERIGSEGKNIIGLIKQNPAIGKVNNNGSEPDPKSIGEFRLSGEIHQWMYDRYSLQKLLEDSGFRNIKLCSAYKSSIPNFSMYELDVEPDNSVRKPDSLFMEAIK